MTSDSSNNTAQNAQDEHDAQDAQSPQSEESSHYWEALAVLAGLTGTTSDQMPLLKIITNPDLHQAAGTDYGDDHVEIADSFEENFSGYMGSDSNGEIQTIADLLFTHYGSVEDAPEFTFGFDANAEGEVGSIFVGAAISRKTAEGYTDYRSRIVLAEWVDPKNATYDREATGLAAALGIAEALNDMYLGLVAKARRRGLLPANPDTVAEATAALAAYDAVPAEEEVDVDTLAALRDSLAALLAAQGATT